MATHASRRAEWRTSTHGRYKPRASYRCLVPDSDIEMCEVSYHQEQASINALNKNISFCTALLPRCQKDPFPPHPLAWASCVRVFCANLIYFFEKQHFLAFFICKSPSENRPKIALSDAYYRTTTASISWLLLAPKVFVCNFLIGKGRNIWWLRRKCVPLQSLNSTTHLIHNTLQNNV